MTQKEKALSVSKIPGTFFFSCHVSLTCYFKASVAASDLPSMQSPRVNIQHKGDQNPCGCPCPSGCSPGEVGVKHPGEPHVQPPDPDDDDDGDDGPTRAGSCKAG